jgi:GAF domain-containing protein
MDMEKKRERYRRIGKQLGELFAKTADPLARMATVTSLLYRKMDDFFWCGFYCLNDGELTVGPYQGSLACLLLEKHVGACWAAIDRRTTVIIPDVHRFPSHIACDPRSRSEIVVPVKNRFGEIIGVLDVDSDALAAFNDVDGEELEKIVGLIYG